MKGEEERGGKGEVDFEAEELEGGGKVDTEFEGGRVEVEEGDWVEPGGEEVAGVGTRKGERENGSDSADVETGMMLERETEAVEEGRKLDEEEEEVEGKMMVSEDSKGGKEGLNQGLAEDGFIGKLGGQNRSCGDGFVFSACEPSAR